MSIDLNPTEDQRQILDAARALLGEHFPVARLRSDAVDPLNEIAAFGGFGLAASEEIGGSGFTVLEEALLHVEFGRHLVSPGALAATIGAQVAARIGRTDLARSAIAGEVRIVLCHPAGNGVQIFAGADADLAVLWHAGELQLIDMTRLAPRHIDGIDPSLPLSRAAVPNEAVIGALNDPPLARLGDLLLSAELLGMAEATRDMAVAYASIRQQFGQPIGAFQAIKHRCANMAIGVEMLSAQLVMAAIAEREGWPDAAFQTAAVRLLAPRIALENGRANIQIHGAIGFSAECDAHFYVKRAHALCQVGGDVDLLDLPAPLTPLERV
jgi:alkylation response protein AidB-like acyl-CoA dehydrogenase